MYRKFNDEHYDEELRKVKDGNLGFFGSRASQLSRYRTYLKYASFKDKAVLDIGCGPMLFWEYLSSRDEIPGYYIGTEIHTPTVEWVRENYKDNNVEIIDGDFLEVPIEDNKYDIVMSCGMFAIKTGSINETETMFKKYVEKMFNICKDGGIVMFSNLSPYKGNYHKNEFLMYPEDMLKFCLRLSERVILDYSYAKHDYMIIIPKGDNDYHKILKEEYAG